jgi:transposase-like protein
MSNTVLIKVVCKACGSEHQIKILPGKSDQRWACPKCKAQHDSVPVG